MTIKILQLCLVLVSSFKEFVEFSLNIAAMGVGKGGQGGPMAPPGFSHTLSKSSQISKILPFLVVNTGSILIGPPLKIFLPTPLIAAQFLKLRLQTKPSLKQIFLQEVFANMIFGFVTYINLSRNLTHNPKYQIYSLK